MAVLSPADESFVLSLLVELSASDIGMVGDVGTEVSVFLPSAPRATRQEDAARRFILVPRRTWQSLLLRDTGTMIPSLLPSNSSFHRPTPKAGPVIRGFASRPCLVGTHVCSEVSGAAESHTLPVRELS